MDKLGEYKRHVLNRINQTDVDFDPFGHLFITEIFPADLYEMIKHKAFFYKNTEATQSRTQDNKNFVNYRYSLAENLDSETQYIKALFNDDDIKLALARKFLINPTIEMLDSLSIHNREFEFMYTKKNKFQNIHVDIPPKILSFVFYIPETLLSDEQQFKNATILYDKSLNPIYKAKYLENSVCVFSPHFYSYHGFSTSVDRTSLVMFYVDESLLKMHQEINVKVQGDLEAEIATFKNSVRKKLELYPLIEYENCMEKINQASFLCKVNAPQGRVI